ncbi:Serine/threonine-protein phosphatase 7 long form homolog [Linum perenne]
MMCLIIWQPYPVDIILRAIRRTPSTIAISWDARVPLLCFHIVEWHFPDRVMRQFGFHQHLPIDVPSNMEELHKIDLRANEHNWPVYHRQYIDLWNSRHTLRMSGIPIRNFKQGYHDEYMQWYRTITRRWISHNGAMHGSVVSISRLCIHGKKFH